MLLVAPSGLKSWYLRKKINDKEQMIFIGRYPGVGLAEARKMASNITARIAQGLPPKEEKKKIETFRRAAEEWLKIHAENLTITNIKNGNSNIRNPILISYAAKGLLPYHGIGSGILRALKAWPDIDFEDDRESSLFKAIVRRTHRPAESTRGLAPELAPKTQNLHQKQGLSEATLRDIASEIAPELFALLESIAANPRITTAELATVLNVSRPRFFTEQPCSKKRAFCAASAPARADTGRFSHEICSQRFGYQISADCRSGMWPCLSRGLADGHVCRYKTHARRFTYRIDADTALVRCRWGYRCLEYLRVLCALCGGMAQTPCGSRNPQLWKKIRCAGAVEVMPPQTVMPQNSIFPRVF